MSTIMLSRFLALWLVFNLTLVVLWDVTVMAFGLETPTVSYYLYLMGRKYPLLYLWIGIGVGHLIMPLVIHNGK